MLTEGSRLEVRGPSVSQQTHLQPEIEARGCSSVGDYLPSLLGLWAASQCCENKHKETVHVKEPSPAHSHHWEVGTGVWAEASR